MSKIKERAKKLTALTLKRKLVVGGVLLVALGGVGAAIYFSKQDEKGPKILIDGKEYDASYLASGQQYQKPSDDQPSSDGKKLLTDLEAKKEAKSVTQEEYLALAQLYAKEGNKDKAVENYELAKKAADPEMDGYKEFIEGIDEIIARVKGRK